MPFNFETIANTATGGILGLALEDHNDRRQLEQAAKLQDMQIQGQKDMTRYNMQQQYDMWLKTNYGPQVEQMKKAGLNPALMYGKGGPGGTTGSAAGSVQGQSAPAGGREVMELTQMGLQKAMMEAQIKLAEAQAKKTDVEATKIGGVDTKNVEADTQNKILQQVINNYAGKEAKDTYERIMAPNRAIQAETYEKEMAARQGIAGTIYELWIDGKLAEKSLNEIEQIALQNAKTRAEVNNIKKQLDILEENLKGQKLENVMKELESKLQTETGIDRNSPAWMKILGRLFIGLLNK